MNTYYENSQITDKKFYNISPWPGQTLFSRQGCPGTNTLAYLASLLVTKKKNRFLTLSRKTPTLWDARTKQNIDVAKHWTLTLVFNHPKLTFYSIDLTNLSKPSMGSEPFLQQFTFFIIYKTLYSLRNFQNTSFSSKFTKHFIFRIIYKTKHFILFKIYKWVQ